MPREELALKCEGVGHPWSQDALQRDENKVHFYTGLPSYRTLIVIFKFVLNNCNNRSFSFEGLLATLMKLRLNLRDQDLEYRLGIHQTTISCNFVRWIDAMYI